MISLEKVRTPGRIDRSPQKDPLTLSRAIEAIRRPRIFLEGNVARINSLPRSIRLHRALASHTLMNHPWSRGVQKVH